MGEASDPDAARRHAGSAAPQQMPDELAGRPIAGAARMLFAAAGIAATALAVNQLLNLQLFAHIVFVDNRYLFLLAACLFPLIFIVFPARARQAGSAPWYDWVIAATACALLLWFAYEAERILNSRYIAELGAQITGHSPVLAGAEHSSSSQSELAQLQITTLASMLGSTSWKRSS